MSKHLIFALSAIVAVSGCGLIDSIENQIDTIKQSVSDIKSAASGDIAASNTAIEGASVAAKSAFEEVGGALDSAGEGEGSGKRTATLKAALQPLQGGSETIDTTISEDCDEGGSISRKIVAEISEADGKGVVNLETTAENCKFYLDDGGSDPEISSIVVSGSGSGATVVTINGNNFGTPATDGSDDDNYEVVLSAVGGSANDITSVVPSQDIVGLWSDTQIKVRIAEFEFLLGGEIEVDVYVEDDQSNLVEFDGSKDGTTNAKAGLTTAQDDGDSEPELVHVNGKQVIELDINLDFSGDEMEPTSVNSISFVADAWTSEILVDDEAISSVVYTDFSMVGEAVTDGVSLTMDGSLSVSEEDFSFTAGYEELVVVMAQEGLLASDGDGEDEAQSVEVSIDGGISLDIGVDGNTCVDKSFEFETVTPLSTDFEDCAEAGVIIVRTEVEGGIVEVQYTFSADGQVSILGSGGTETSIDCNSIAGPAATCLNAAAADQIPDL